MSRPDEVMPRMASGLGPLDAKNSARRIARGGLSLVARQVITYGASFLSGILVARILAPEDFGISALVTFAAGLIQLLTNAGLSASLIQQQHEPTASERSTVFTTQFVIGLLLAGALAAAAPWIANLYGGVPGTVWALNLTALALAITPLTSLALMGLQRRLDFVRIGMILAIQAITTSAVVALLAWLGLGTVSFGGALLAGNLVALPLAIRAGGPPPRLGFRFADLRGKLRFGLVYTGPGLISAVKDAANPLFIGLVIGTAAAGYTRWAMQLATLGAFLVFALDSMMFSGFARLKEDRVALTRSVETGIFWANALAAPIVVLMLIFTRDVTLGLYGEAWLPAVDLVRLLLLGSLLSPTGAVLFSLMNALGKPRVPLAFAIAWFAATWVLLPLFTPFAGLEAYGWANLVMEPISVVLFVIARRELRFRLVGPALLPWVLALLAATPAFALHLTVPLAPLWALILIVIGSIAIFAALIWLLAPAERRLLWRMVKAA